MCGLPATQRTRPLAVPLAKTAPAALRICAKTDGAVPEMKVGLIGVAPAAMSAGLLSKSKPTWSPTAVRAAAVAVFAPAPAAFGSVLEVAEQAASRPTAAGRKKAIRMGRSVMKGTTWVALCRDASHALCHDRYRGTSFSHNDLLIPPRSFL